MCAAQLGLHIFRECGLRATPAAAMDVMCQLYYCCLSRLCVIYDVDARTMRGGNPEPLDVLEYVVKGLVRGVQKEADRQKAQRAIWWWRSSLMRAFTARLPGLDGQARALHHRGEVPGLKSVCDMPDRPLLNELRVADLSGQMTVDDLKDAEMPSGDTIWTALWPWCCRRSASFAPLGRPPRSLSMSCSRPCVTPCPRTSSRAAAQTDLQSEDEDHGADRDRVAETAPRAQDPDRVGQRRHGADDARRGRGRSGPVLDERPPLDETAAIGPVLDETAAILLYKSLLNDALHLSLEQDRVDMARLFLDYGTGTDLYDREHRKKHSKATYWKWLLASACEAMLGEDDYLERPVARCSPAGFSIRQSFEFTTRLVATSALELIERK